jgi:hypothetical protein
MPAIRLQFICLSLLFLLFFDWFDSFRVAFGLDRETSSSMAVVAVVRIGGGDNNRQSVQYSTEYSIQYRVENTRYNISTITSHHTTLHYITHT